jgi:hypothetical protein
MFIYGSKARGDDHPESDVDMFLIIRNDAHHLKRELRHLSYLLAATSEIVPSILVYTEDEWESRRKSGSSFHEAVERDVVLALWVGGTIMEQPLEQQLRAALEELPSEDIQAVIAFAHFLQSRRLDKEKAKTEPELSEAEYARILRVLDAVAVLSAETGPPVSNRNHDRYLYGS